VTPRETRSTRVPRSTVQIETPLVITESEKTIPKRKLFVTPSKSKFHRQRRRETQKTPKSTTRQTLQSLSKKT